MTENFVSSAFLPIWWCQYILFLKMFMLIYDVPLAEHSCVNSGPAQRNGNLPFFQTPDTTNNSNLLIPLWIAWRQRILLCWLVTVKSLLKIHFLSKRRPPSSLSMLKCSVLLLYPEMGLNCYDLRFLCSVAYIMHMLHCANHVFIKKIQKRHSLGSLVIWDLGGTQTSSTDRSLLLN